MIERMRPIHKADGKPPPRQLRRAVGRHLGWYGRRNRHRSIPARTQTYSPAMRGDIPDSCRADRPSRVEFSRRTASLAAAAAEANGLRRLQVLSAPGHRRVFHRPMAAQWRCHLGKITDRHNLRLSRGVGALSVRVARCRCDGGGRRGYGVVQYCGPSGNRDAQQPLVSCVRRRRSVALRRFPLRRNIVVARGA